MVINWWPKSLRLIRKSASLRSRWSRLSSAVAPVCAMVETLEDRSLLSGMTVTTQTDRVLPVALAGGSASDEVYYTPNYRILSPFAASPVGFTPAQITQAYGINNILFGSIRGDGTGQTVAVVAAYHTPTALNDLVQFSTQFGLPDPTNLFTQVSQTGSTTNFPPVDPAGPGAPNGNWAGEALLDIQWVHAVAPGARILLVEADSPSSTDLSTAVSFAKAQPGVSVVNMSYGGAESSQDLLENNVYTTPTGHNGVTFVAATGDSGAPGGYPAFSPNVLAVGGTTLTLNAQNAIQTEVGWSRTSPNSGSGGGISQFQSQPSYQTGIVTQSPTFRTIPDVALNADPATGVAVFDTYNNPPSSPWSQVGGTSFSSPAWSGIIAIANQGRTIAGVGTLDGPTQTLPSIYQLPSSAFNDITSGNNGFNAGVGYDLVTGRGSPRAAQVVSGLLGPSVFGIPDIDLNGNLTGKDFTATFNVNGVPVLTQAATATLADPGTINLTSLTVTITNLADGTAERLTATTTGTNIAQTFSNGRLRLTGSDTVTNYQQVLRTIAYQNTSSFPDMSDRLITFSASDGTNSSNVATATISCVTPTV